MSVFVEPLNTKIPLICFGAGHIAKEFCPLAMKCGFEIFLVDERSEFLTAKEFSTIKNKTLGSSKFDIKNLPFSDKTFVLIVTHDHKTDQELAEAILAYDFHFAALVGSNRKAIMTKKRLEAKNFSKQFINKIICPAGLEIGGQTPTEIAISIMAQMVKVKSELLKGCSINSGSRLKLSHGKKQSAA